MRIATFNLCEQSDMLAGADRVHLCHGEED